jgi:uridine phosphorylase
MQLAEKINARRSDHWLYGERQPFFTGDLDGNPICLVEMPVGAPGTIMIMEEMIACGARTFMGLGWAGSLQPDSPVGSFIIPTTCISEEGTTAHYLGPGKKLVANLKADPILAEALDNAAQKAGVSTRTGPQWTTDAPYRELRDKVRTFREAGILGVDMETSAMYALARFRGVRVCNLLVISDVLGSEWQPGFGTDLLQAANEIAQEVVLESIFTS